MFNFNFYFLVYLLKHSPLTYNLLSFEKRYLLTQLQMHPEFNFLFKFKFKLIYIIYQLQHISLFISFVFLGFFIFSLVYNSFCVDNFYLSSFKIWDDFINLHYVSFFMFFCLFFHYSA